jgi:hypothetical protein
MSIQCAGKVKTANQDIFLHARMDAHVRRNSHLVMQRLVFDMRNHSRPELVRMYSLRFFLCPGTFEITILSFEVNMIVFRVQGFLEKSVSKPGFSNQAS